MDGLTEHPSEAHDADMVVLDRDSRASRRARAWLDRLYRPELHIDVLDCACLVLSELVTNALRHGTGQIVVRSSVDGSGRLVLSVSDSGGGHPVVKPTNPSRVGGVGLVVVDALAAEWGFAAFPGGKSVWAKLDTSGGTQVGQARP